MKRLFVVSEVNTPEDIRSRLASPERQWREGYSAYELAHAWVKANDFPPALRAVMDADPTFRGARLIEAFFERKVDLETPGEPSHNDILVYAKLKAGFAAIAVEGKVKEPFDKYVRDKEMTPGVVRRLDHLCGRLGLNRTDVQWIRYQLLHRTVSALLEAERYAAEHAVMLVYSFDPTDTSFIDYRDFAVLLGFAPAEIRPNQIVGYKELGGIKLHLGWVRDVPTVGQSPVSYPPKVVRSEPAIAAAKQPPAEQTTLAHLLDQIVNSKREGMPKSARSISSNISSGFKARTGGEDYKVAYDDGLRSQIAAWGAVHGVPVALIVEFVVLVKDESWQTKRKQIAEVSRRLG